MSAQAKDTSGIDDEDRTSPGVQPGRAVGFRAKLAGVGLWDLVQMECLAGSHLVVLVTGEGGIGYLYFDHGQIVHAVTTDTWARRPRWRSSAGPTARSSPAIAPGRRWPRSRRHMRL